MSMSLDDIFDCDWNDLYPTDSDDLFFMMEEEDIDPSKHTLTGNGVATTDPTVDPTSSGAAHSFPLFTSTTSTAAFHEQCWEDHRRLVQEHERFLIGEQLLEPTWRRSFLVGPFPSRSTSAFTTTGTSTTQMHIANTDREARPRRRVSSDGSSASYTTTGTSSTAQMDITNTDTEVRPRTVSDGSSASYTTTGTSTTQMQITNTDTEGRPRTVSDGSSASYATTGTSTTTQMHITNTDTEVRPRTVSDGSSASFSSGNSCWSSSPEPTNRKIYVESEEIQDTDVLFGRGSCSNNHPGNVDYRRRILANQPAYKTLNDKMKQMMSASIVQWVKMERKGRFLALDKTPQGNRCYSVATDQQAQAKVSQALREDHTPEGRALKKARLTVNRLKQNNTTISQEVVEA